MKSPNQTGKNRTGIQTSPLDERELERAAAAHPPTSAADAAELRRVRLEAAQASEPVGTMPPPATLKGVAKSAISLLKGKSPTLFLNKLGERLAFERGGVRLYAAVIDKLPAFGSVAGAPTAAELRVIQAEELRHVDVVRRAVEALGGDPTAMTPAADLGGVAATGLFQVACDPRAQLADSLQALLVAELADNDGWTLLLELARGLGQAEMVTEFMRCADAERIHLARVRGWLTALVMQDAGIAEAAAAPPP